MMNKNWWQRIDEARKETYRLDDGSLIVKVTEVGHVLGEQYSARVHPFNPLTGRIHCDSQGIGGEFGFHKSAKARDAAITRYMNRCNLKFKDYACKG